jgi:predicted membrane metal-binding protein
VIGIIGGAYAPLTIFFGLILLVAFGVELWAFIDAVRRPAGAFTAAGKQTKPIWLLILGVASVVGLAFALYGGITSILAVAAFAAAAIYHVDVRPKVKDYRKGGGSSNGPYGPW